MSENNTEELQEAFRNLMGTRFDPDKEIEALEILEACPALAKAAWLDLGEENAENDEGAEIIYNSTALHYAANDGKLDLMQRLIELGADVNADEANWFATPLAWAANNARIDAMQLLIDNGADANGQHALHAVAFGGNSGGQDDPEAYVSAAQLLLEHGARIDDTNEPEGRTPYAVAVECGNSAVAEFLVSNGAEQ